MIWKSIPQFENYKVSNSGVVVNTTSGKELTNSVHSDGTSMPCVSLVKNNEVHVFETRFIVACTFLGADINSNPKPKIQYIDGNKFNNSVDNLKIVTTESLENEEWKPIEGFETSYAISNKGRVKRLERIDKYIRKDTGKAVERRVGELILKLVDSQGYYEVNLREGEKSEYRRVHRMVASAFLTRLEGQDEVNHIDGDKHNNDVANLEWCTHKQNVEHSIVTGLRKSYKGTDRTAKQIRCIETGQIFNNLKETATSMNLSYNYLNDCIHENRECHGFHFEQITSDLRVKCLDTGEVFDTLNDACEHFKVNDIANSIKRRTCVNGWTFCYLKDNIGNESEYLQECRNRYSQWPRANKRWEDNK